jgi:hypothetical protein
MMVSSSRYFGKRGSASIVAVSFVFGIMVVSACRNRCEVIDLVEVEALQDVCLPVPEGFRRIEGFCGVTIPRPDYVCFSHWGWRYPEYLVVVRVENEKEAKEQTKSYIERHHNGDWNRPIPELATDVLEIPFRDTYAEDAARIFVSLTTIEEQKYLILAYCHSCREYCEIFKNAVAELQPCSELESYLRASESANIPPCPPQKPHPE